MDTQEWFSVCSCREEEEIVTINEKTGLIFRTAPACRCKATRNLLLVGLGTLLATVASLIVIFRSSQIYGHLRPFPLATDTLRWQPCGTNIYCANLSVPLNYINHKDKRRAYIAINKYSVPSEKKVGSIIFNPGGPGGSGTNALYRLGPIINTIVEGQFDIISFDPRGMNMTFPKVECIKDTDQRRALEEVIKSTAPNLRLHDVALWDSYSKIIADQCHEITGEALSYVNTPTVVRDIASIVDALRNTDHRAIVNYWGFSYGTNIGAMLVGMFPNKLNKIILDGIRSPLDSREIYEWGYTALSSQNDAVEEFFRICEQVGPKRCILAGSTTTVKDQIMNLMMSLHDQPLAVSTPEFQKLVTFYSYKEYFYSILHRPVQWPLFANITRDLLNGNGTSFITLQTQTKSSFEMGDAGAAVLCTDAAPATSYTLDSWTEFVRNMTSVSFIDGDSRSLDTLVCRHWSALPNERWTGGFEEVERDVPVLVLANTNDPATPISSARRLLGHMNRHDKVSGEDRVVNAVMVEQNSTGHCSVSTVSTCTHQIVLAYLINGTLPDHQNTVCQLDDMESGDYFPSNDITTKSIYGELALAMSHEL